MDLNLVRDIFEDYAKNKNFSGTVLIKQGEKELFSCTHGYAHIGWEIRNTLDTRFDTASITKLFTAVSILQLVDKNLIKLEDKALDILDIENGEISKDINLYHLLTHTSGIGDDADEESGESYEEIWREKPNYSVRECRDFIPQFVYKKPYFSPEKGCRYNNCAYILLGLVIEKISGKSYIEYVKENIFKKASMNNSDFLSMDGIHKNMAEGYVSIENSDKEILGFRKNIYSYPPVGCSDGGAHTTVGDLDIFIRNILNNKLLSERLTNEILKPKEFYIENSKRDFYMGYGFEFILRKRDHKVFCITKDGSNAGVACVTRYFPENDITFTILSNNDSCDIWDIAFKVQPHLGIIME
ncbi:serine hydrolase domain-containing protein [Clostridium hydrogeniformans]|uniref:serine hydrolase domain-containing protein n=1 Tax=Clostridium hydrogeniformans TaxID=349933 RepID=UPI00048122B9|nr:serine hydrolase domain-containing protein [Clostridium hydrogeniformans]